MAVVHRTCASLCLCLCLCVCVSVCFVFGGLGAPSDADATRRASFYRLDAGVGRRWVFFLFLFPCAARALQTRNTPKHARRPQLVDTTTTSVSPFLFCFFFVLFFNAGRRIRHDDAGVVNATPPPPPRESFPFFFRPLFVQRGELLFQFCIFFGGGGLLWLGSGRVPERGRIRENGAPKRTPKFVAISMNQPNTKEIDDCIVDVVYRLSGVDIEPHIDILGRYIECRNTDRGVTS